MSHHAWPFPVLIFNYSNHLKNLRNILFWNLKDNFNQLEIERKYIPSILIPLLFFEKPWWQVIIVDIKGEADLGEELTVQCRGTGMAIQL